MFTADRQMIGELLCCLVSMQFVVLS